MIKRNKYLIVAIPSLSGHSFGLKKRKEKDKPEMMSQSLRYQVTPSDGVEQDISPLHRAKASQSLRYQVTPSDGEKFEIPGTAFKASQSLRYQVTPSDSAPESDQLGCPAVAIPSLSGHSFGSGGSGTNKYPFKVAIPSLSGHSFGYELKVEKLSDAELSQSLRYQVTPSDSNEKEK